MRLSFVPPRPDEFKRLYDQTGWADWGLERFESALAGSWIVCAARDTDEALVGIGRIISDGALHAFVTEMVVDESSRGSGLGARILAALVEESRARGVTDVQLFAASGRRAFYERNGFRARSSDGPGMDLVTERSRPQPNETAAE